MTEQELQRREALIEKRLEADKVKQAQAARTLEDRHKKQRANAAHQRLLSQIIVGAC